MHAVLMWLATLDMAMTMLRHLDTFELHYAYQNWPGQ